MPSFIRSILLTTLFLAPPAFAQSLSSAASDTGIPSGAVIPFTTNCPAGFTEYTLAAGRALVGTGTFSQSHRGRFYSTTYTRGARGGVALYSMNLNEMPRHRHTDIGASRGDADGSPGGQGWGGSHTTGYSGSGSAFDNRQPYIALTMCRKD